MHYSCSNCHTRLPHKLQVCPSCRARITIHCQLCGFTSDHEFFILSGPEHYPVCPECLVIQNDQDANSQVCPQCLAELPLFRKPKNREEAMWGGQSCPKCGYQIPGWKKPKDYTRPIVKQCPQCLSGLPIDAKKCTTCGREFSDQEVAEVSAAIQARKTAWAKAIQDDRKKTRNFGSCLLLVLGGIGVLGGLITGLALVASSAATPENFALENSIGLFPTLILCAGPLLLLGGAFLYFGLRARRKNNQPIQAPASANPQTE